MNETPWLQPDTLKLVKMLLKSHQRVFQRPLLKFEEATDNICTISQELFKVNMPIMAHNNQPDTNLIYANASALTLWCRRWDEMIGMPSRYTAPIEEQSNRRASLEKAKKKDAITGYKGIRIDSHGRKFLITNARIWTIWNEQDIPYGQAATFSKWKRFL